MTGVKQGIQCMSCSSRIISEMLPDIHPMEKFEFLKYKLFSNFNSLLHVNYNASHSINKKKYRRFSKSHIRQNKPQSSR